MVVLEMIDPANRASFLAYFHGETARQTGFMWMHGTPRYGVCRECAADLLAEMNPNGEPNQERQWGHIVPGDPAEYADDVNDEGA
jgi:hypothetical protein